MFGYQYIVNPMTKRKVSVHTTKGKQIINNFLKSLQVAGSNIRLETLKQSVSQRGLAPKAPYSKVLKQSTSKVPNSLRNKPPITKKPHSLVVKPTKKPIPQKLIREVTTFSKGTTDRLSAGEYYRYGGEEGDICDIRGDGELRCLIIGKNGTPSWKNITKNKTTLTYKTCGPGPWKKKCAISLEKK
jgi:hypothetical protein